MDVEESIESCGVRIGDMVLPVESEEFLFLSADGLDVEFDPIECCWSGMPGLVTNILEFDPPRDYLRVCVMVGGVVGWTYSDYVRVVS